MPHSRFRHDSHRMLSCVECHAATTSHRTSDILMPAIHSCKQCHNAQAGARTDCYACHRYHNPATERGFNGKWTIATFLGDASSE
jgi:hypothetical protein